MNIRWGARIVGVLLLIVFALVMSNLYKQLRSLEASQPAATATSEEP